MARPPPQPPHGLKGPLRERVPRLKHRGEGFLLPTGCPRAADWGDPSTLTAGYCVSTSTPDRGHEGSPGKCQAACARGQGKTPCQVLEHTLIPGRIGCCQGRIRGRREGYQAGHRVVGVVKPACDITRLSTAGKCTAQRVAAHTYCEPNKDASTLACLCPMAYTHASQERGGSVPSAAPFCGPTAALKVKTAHFCKDSG